MGWRDERQDFKKLYSWEDYYANPYAEQIDTAASAAQYDAARKAYIAWTATQEQYQQQLSDSIALRNSERAYYSPTEQLRRLRAAGINPDIQSSGTGSSTSSGGSAMPAVPSLSPSQFQSPSPDVPTDVEWMQAAGTMLTQVGTFANQVVGLVEQASSMSSVLSMRRSQSESAALQTYRDRMLAVGELAQGLPVGEDISEKQIDSYLDDLLVDDQSLRSGLKHYVKTPSYQAAVNDAMMRHRKSQSWLQSMPLHSLNDFHEAQRRAELARAQADQYESEFYKEVSAWQYRRYEEYDDGTTAMMDLEPDYQSAQRLGLSNRADREQDVQRHQRARTVYSQHLSNLKETISRIDEELAVLEQYPDGQDVNALILAKKIERMQIMALGNESLSSLYDYAMQSLKRSYDSIAAGGDDLNVAFGEQALREHKLAFSDRIFMSNIMSDDGSIDKVLKVVDMLFNIGTSLSPAGRVINTTKNITQNVTKNVIKP